MAPTYKVYITEVNEAQPTLHWISDYTGGLRKGFLHTECGIKLSFRYTDVVLQYRHARRFAQLCKECSNGGNQRTSNESA